MAFVRAGTTLHIPTDTGTACGKSGVPTHNADDNDILCSECLRTSLNANEEIPFGNAPVNVVARWMQQQYETMPYREYLRTQHWDTVRRLAIEHYGSSCVLCNSSPINVHHRTYERRGRERLDDLIVICDNCHATYHGKAA